MLVAWRHKLPTDAAEITGGQGGWEQYREAFAAENIHELLEGFGLTAQAHEYPRASAVRALLAEHGPLFIAPQDGGDQARVITGIGSDPVGELTVNNPVSGEKETKLLKELVRELINAGQNHIVPRV